MKKIDLELLQNKIEHFVEERDWDQFHSLKNLSMALCRESSELMEIFQWMTEEQSNKVKNDSHLMDKLEDEVADVFIYLLRMVSKTGMNLENAIDKKMKKNAEKYPVHLSKGNSKKYDQF